MLTTRPSKSALAAALAATGLAVASCGNPIGSGAAPTTAESPSVSSSDVAQVDAQAAEAMDRLEKQANNARPVQVDFLTEQPTSQTAAGTEILGTSLSRALDKAGLTMSSDANVYIARVTTPTMGENLEADRSKPARIQPDFNNDLSWVIRFHHVPVAAIGGPIDRRSDRQPEQAFSDLVLFLKPDGFWAASEIPEETPQ